MKSWWMGGVIYQIWPRSFSDGNGDGVGDLRGIIDRLDYLNDGKVGGLGVDAIWLSPIFKSPLIDYGYDISDYTAIDPLFGTLDDLDDLILEAHRRSMRVILDLVPNHTSDLHPWFVESSCSRTNSKRDWYVWRKPGSDGGPPNNWRSAFASVGSAWTFHDQTGEYYLHSYTRNQPDLNWDNPDVREAIGDAMRFWFARGVDGFRIDVVHRLAKNPSLADNPPGMDDLEPRGPGRNDADWETIADRLGALRAVADEYDDRVLIGEVYILDQSRLVDYLGDDRLHLAHDFVSLNSAWGLDLGLNIDNFERLAGDRGPVGAWCFNNHDHSRVRSRWDVDGQGEARARAAAVVLFALRGTVFIYQGEELGLPDSDVPDGLHFDFNGRDAVRTPIPWASPDDVGPGAGFTSSDNPWLPVGQSAGELNVEASSTDPNSMLTLYRKLIALRRELPAVHTGTYRTIEVSEQVFHFERRFEDQVVDVWVNFSDVDLPLNIGRVHEEPETTAVSSLLDYRLGVLGPNEARWLVRRDPDADSPTPT